MRLHPCILILLLLGARASAQGLAPTTVPFEPGPITSEQASPFAGGAPGTAPSEPLTSNRNFPGFIGFFSNPLQNIDPRSLTQVVPIFGSTWVSTGPVLPDLNAQIYGPALSLALTDRLSVGLNQGGFATAHIDTGDARGPLLTRLSDRIARTRGLQFGGTRDGFLNLGGYGQYTFIQDVEDQFLATGGLRVTVPCGAYELFQGMGPALLAPYLTVGKEFGNFHLLATTGYQFPARSGDSGTELFYLNAHLDRQCFGWIYPLVEVNWINHTSSVDVNLPTRRGYIDFGNFESTGNVVTVGGGVNFVLIRDRLEVGGIYSRSVSTTRNIDVDTLIMKMVLRY